MKFKLGLVSVSFRGLSPQEILEAMQGTPLTCIEWGSDVHVPPEKAPEIAALQKQYGIACCSYGTYFRLGVTPIEELASYIHAAKLLGTNILRLWCGDKNSQDYDPAEKAALFDQCKAAAAIAERNGVVLCMECHNWTYTNTKESALELMQAIGSASFRMYWQPNQYTSEAENIAYAGLLSPYTVHLHVFNWAGDEKYPLSQAEDTWKTYLEVFEKDKALLLEFMPDGNIESLRTEAQALWKIAGGL